MIGVRPAAQPLRSRSRGSVLQRKEAWSAYLFILPNTAGLVIFFCIPIIASLVLSFMSWDLVQAPKWTGLDNYVTLVHDPQFWTALVNTIYYTVVSVPLSIFLALLLAVALNRQLRERTWYRVAYFMPWVTMPVAIALVWKWLYDPQFGLIDNFLAGFNLPQPQWLNDPAWSMPSVIIMGVWKNLGYNMIIFLAGLQGISAELYEAASIDGAGAISRFWRVTVPLISPATFFVLVISLINSFQVFDQIYALSNANPTDALRVLATQIYANGFQYFKMGYATSIAWALFALVLIVTLVQVAVQRRWVHYES